MPPSPSAAVIGAGIDGNRARMCTPELDDLVFVGSAQATPTQFPFVEARVRLVAASAAGLYATPDVEEIRRVIGQDERKNVGHVLDAPEHRDGVTA